MNVKKVSFGPVTVLVMLLSGLAIGLSLGYAVFGGGDGPAEVASVPDEPTGTDGELPGGTATSAVEAALVESEAEVDPVDASRHLFVAVNGQWLAQATTAFLSEVRPGGVILRDANIQNRSQTFALVKEIKRAVGIGEGLGDRPLIGVAHEGGSQNHLGLASAPSAQELGASSDEALARKLGTEYAQASVGRGIAVVFAPVLDVFETGSVNPALQARTFGDDQTMVAKMGLAMSDGLRQGGVVPVVKHFPGYGAATYGPDGMLVVLNKDFNGLARIMYPFNEAVRRNVPGILAGYVAVPSLDKEHPRRPAALSPVLVTELLRNRWGFEGVVVADDISFNDMTRSLPMGQTAVEALAAGCDAVIMMDPNPERVRSVVSAIEQAVEAETLSLDQLDMSKARLDHWQRMIGNSMPLKPAPKALVASTPKPPETPPAKEEPEVAVVEEATRSEPARETVSGPKDDLLEVAATEPAPVKAPEKAEERVVDEGPERSPDPISVAKAEPEFLEAEPADATENERVLVETIEEPPPQALPEKFEERAEDAATVAEAPSEEAVKPVKEASVEVAEPKVTEPEVDEEIVVAKATDDEDLSDRSVIEHSVKEGERLEAIARLYGVRDADLMKWNDLPTDMLEPGDRLKVYIPSEKPSFDFDLEEKKEEEEPVKVASVGETAGSLKVTHLVQPGETLGGLAERYGVTMKEIRLWNGLEREELWKDESLTIFVGSDRPVPETGEVPAMPTERYTVQPGDTLFKIARKHGTTSELLLQLNNLSNPDHVWVGQRLKVPAAQ